MMRGVSDSPYCCAEPVPVLEIGGTHVTAALVDAAAGQVLEETRRRGELRAEAPADELLSGILECADGLGVTAGARWGVAVPGPFDYARGIGLFSGVGKFDSLFGVDLRRAFLERLPAGSQVSFVNDAHAFTLGEWSAGAACGHSRVVGITLGTGVGSAFLLDGKVVDNAPNLPPEGHVHLLTLEGRPLEETVSRRAILRRYAELTGGGQGGAVDVRDIAELARRGDQTARQVLDHAFFALGTALRPWTTGFRATMLVVGGAVAGSWDLIVEPLRAGLDQTAARLTAEEGPPGIELARADHVGDAALLGAAWQTLHHRPGSCGKPAR